MHGALGRGLYRKHGFYRKHRSNRLATAPKHKRAPHTRQVREPELRQRPMVMPAKDCTPPRSLVKRHRGLRKGKVGSRQRVLSKAG
jgi:hypothetical protein